MSIYYFEAVHRILTNIRDDYSLFEDIATVFDFAKILPVIRCGTYVDIVAASLRKFFYGRISKFFRRSKPPFCRIDS